MYAQPVPGVPDSWRWRADVIEAGPAVIVDLDGTLSDAAGRQHFLERPRSDWQAFFDACGDDPVIAEVARLLELLDRDLTIVLLTARPVRIRDLTLAWLARYGLRWDLLVMRATRDFRSSPDAKRVAVHDLRDHGFDLRIAFDDDPRNVEMFHGEGIPCVYLHSGYY
jgi:beta-phosphoglucomutase-like phosphatase (HAD superfamily)